MNRYTKRKRLFRSLPDVHPLIRLVALLLFTAGMALARPALLVAGAGLLLLLYLFTGLPDPGRLLLMFKRLRWLLLAIVLVYGWWTPGLSLFPQLGGLSPTLEGLHSGLRRGGALLLIVAAVHLLLQLTPRHRLLPAIIQLLSPVTSTAIRERLAVRMLLTIEAVGQVQPLVCEALQQPPGDGSRFAALGQTARGIYLQVLERAGQSGPDRIEVAEITAPPHWQWLIPLSLAAGLVAGI